MSRLINIKGQRFGRLVVKSRSPIKKQRAVCWNCICDCGGTNIVPGITLRAGRIKSCGCLQRESVVKRNIASATHGYNRYNYAFPRAWAAWNSMQKRCYFKKGIQYKDYGGRGITVCKRWAKFENFLADMGEAPPGLTLERKNNNGNYTPTNCRWATQKEQANNKRNSRWITYKDERKTLAQWSEYFQIKYGTLERRLKTWSVHKAFTTPLRKIVGGKYKFLVSLTATRGSHGHRNR